MSVPLALHRADNLVHPYADEITWLNRVRREAEINFRNLHVYMKKALW